jgi:Ca2+-binding RTX toxin-like protein
LLFDHSQITGIRIELGGGNDEAGVSDFYGDFDIPVTMIGGTGRDDLQGGRADDFIDGGTGADTIAGGGGNDVILDDGATIDPDLIIDRNDVVHGTARLEDGIVKIVLTRSEDNDLMVGTAFVPGKLPVTVDGLTRRFDTAAVRGIYVDAGPGNDAVYFYNGIYGLVNVPLTVMGGAGNDTIDGQGDRDSEQHTIAVRGGGPYAPVTLIGGDGDDSLYGGIGDALMDGGAGNDRFVNGWGRNTILDEPPTPADPVTPVDPVVEPALEGSGQNT